MMICASGQSVSQVRSTKGLGIKVKQAEPRCGAGRRTGSITRFLFCSGNQRRMSPSSFTHLLLRAGDVREAAAGRLAGCWPGWRPPLCPTVDNWQLQGCSSLSAFGPMTE